MEKLSSELTKKMETLIHINNRNINKRINNAKNYHSALFFFFFWGGGGHEKPIERGLPKKGGLGQFADLRGVLKRKRGCC